MRDRLPSQGKKEYFQLEYFQFIRLSDYHGVDFHPLV